MTCHRCHKDYGDIDGYRLMHYDKRWDYCSRLCLVEGIAPELCKAISPVQWLSSYDPSPEEVERMSQ